MVEMAKAAVQHFGPTTCPVISKLATITPKRGEDVAHKLSPGLSLELYTRLD